jgi:peroxiredoxin
MKSILFAVTLMFSFACTKAVDGYKPGDIVKDFKLKNVDGSMLSLADYKDAKGIILIFSCNHCPFVVAYEDRMIALHSKYASKGYPVVTINPNDPVREPDDSYDKMVVRAKEKNFPFAYLHDETQEIAKTYGAARTPHAYILNKKGNDYVVEYIGAIDDNSSDASAVKTKYVEQTVDNLLVGKKVTTNFTKAVGCTIKWKKTE